MGPHNRMNVTEKVDLRASLSRLAAYMRGDVPAIAAALVLARGPRRIAVWAGFFPAIVLQPVFLLALYYGLRALGVQGLAVDLTLYVLTMAGGFLLAARLSRSGPARRLTGVSLLAVMLYGAALVLFTFAAPPLGIFQP